MPKRTTHHGLSDRERQVIEKAALGMTDHQIAEDLKIRPSTVATYWQRIRLKYGGHPRAELVLAVYREIYEARLNQLRKEISSLRADKGESDDECRMALDSAADAVFVVDRTGRIVHANRFAESLFGYGPGELDGVAHEQLLRPLDRFRHRSEMKCFFTDPAPQKMGVHERATAMRKDGTTFQIEASIAPIESAQIQSAICIARQSLPET